MDYHKLHTCLHSDFLFSYLKHKITKECVTLLNVKNHLSLTSNQNWLLRICLVLFTYQQLFSFYSSSPVHFENCCESNNFSYRKVGNLQDNFFQEMSKRCHYICCDISVRCIFSIYCYNLTNAYQKPTLKWKINKWCII